MKRRCIQLALWLTAATTSSLAQCRFPVAGTGPVLTYTFDASVTPTSTILHVTLGFRGSGELEEEVEVPSQWAGETFHGVTNLRALSADTIVGDTGSPGRKRLRHRPDQEIVLAWDMVKDWTGRFTHPAQFRGTLLPEYIEVNGENALIYPKLSSETPITVHFDWRKLPASWVLATSFGTASGPDGRCQSYSGPLSSVRQALFAAGEFRIHRFPIGTCPAVLAIRGEWTFSDDEAIASIQKAIAIVRDFWHDDNFPYFLVTVKPFDDDAGQGDGSAFTNAFWLYLSRRDSISHGWPAQALVHETFHEWDPLRMGTQSAGSSDIVWFTEGFTRYYANVLSSRAKLIPLPAFLETINRDLRSYRNSTDEGVRGSIIALWLDQRIRKDARGKASLDNVMFEMVKETSRPLTQARIVETAGRYLSSGSRAELAQMVQPGSRMPELEDALGPCVHGSVDEVATFDLGFDLAASRAAGIVTGTEQGGPAFRAGLRNGQQLTGRLSIHNNQPDEAALVTIRTGDGRQAIEYYPRGAPVKVMQFHLDQGAYAANPASCPSR